MYGWSRGIILSKLADRLSFVIASPDSTTVISAQRIRTTRRWLNTARSSSEPLAVSKPSIRPVVGRPSPPAIGSWVVMAISASGKGLQAAGTADHEGAAAGARYRGGGQRAAGRQRRER